MKTISIVVPAYNESKNILHFYEEISKILNSLPDYHFTLLFVNDGSRDDTLSQIKSLPATSRNMSVDFLDFSRNFGKEAATSAGLANSLQADAVMMVDADLQHPVELIPDFIAKWEAGSEVVVGVRTENRKIGLVKKLGSSVYYKIMNAISETGITPKATDYRLLDHKVVEEFSKLTEHSRITRGLIDWMGYRRDYVYFKANERFAGEASYSKIKLFKLALSSFVAHSLLPLKFAGYLGLTTTLLSGTLGLFMIIEKYILNDPLNLGISPITQLATLIVFLIGIILCCLGLVALYIGLISTETQNRPLYIIRERKG
jgi:glycosyltransferase involved in cell wall biosynthesis